MPELKNLAGLRFGALEVISRVESSPTKAIRWLAKCDCGRYGQPLGANLRSGRATTCGCRMTTRTTFKATKICARCKLEKDHSFFRFTSDTKMSSYCDVCTKEINRAAYRANADGIKAISRAASDALKVDALAAYGPGCKCCGEGNPVFLAIDHLHGGGSAHRRELGNKGGTKFYRWLKNRGYPPGYAVLCHNCNWAKYRTGDCCPHKQPSWMPPTFGGLCCIGG